MNEKFAPAANKIVQTRWISAILSGFYKYMPIVLVGALLQIITNISGALGLESQVVDLLKTMYNLTFGLMGLFLSFTIAHSLAERLKIDAVTSGLIAVSSFLLLQKPTLAGEGFGVQLSFLFYRLGGQSIFMAILVAIFTAETMGLFIHKKWTFSSPSLPDFVRKWFEPIIPGIVVIISCWLLVNVANVDLYELISLLVVPLTKASDTYIVFILLEVLFMFLFVIGINPAITFGVMFPIWFANLAENAALVQQGLEPIHIATLQTGQAWVVIGGSGATLALNLWMLKSKSKTMRSLSRVALFPSLLNINEPLIFGLPIAFNPILSIPFILNGGLINPTIVYLAMSSGLVTKPFAMTPSWLPSPVIAFLTNQDWRGVVLVFVILAIDAAVWYPFFKAYEKNLIAKEAAEE